MNTNLSSQTVQLISQGYEALKENFEDSAIPPIELNTALNDLYHFLSNKSRTIPAELAQILYIAVSGNNSSKLKDFKALSGVTWSKDKISEKSLEPYREEDGSCKYKSYGHKFLTITDEAIESYKKENRK